MPDYTDDTLVSDATRLGEAQPSSQDKRLGRARVPTSAPAAPKKPANTAMKAAAGHHLGQTPNPVRGKHTRAQDELQAQNSAAKQKKQRRDRPNLPDQNRIDPNRMVHNASNTVAIKGHSCANICQKLGLAKCVCKKKQSLRYLFMAMIVLRQRLAPQNWAIFNKLPAWALRPSNRHLCLTPDHLDDDLVAEDEPQDIFLVSDDLNTDFELTDDPFIMVLRAKVPYVQLSREFESFLKQLAPELGVNDHQQLYEMGYQMRHDPEQGITALRLPRPEHQLLCLQHFARTGCIHHNEHTINVKFIDMMKARYATPRPTAHGCTRRYHVVDEMMQEKALLNPLAQADLNPAFNPTPLNMQPQPNRQANGGKANG